MNGDLNILIQSGINHAWFPARSAEYFRWYPKTLTRPNGLESLKPCSIEGVYIHVPFCDKICAFCTYTKSLTEASVITQYVKCLTQEVNLHQYRGVVGPLQYIYFGGGTPSVLSASQIQSIIKTLTTSFGLSPTCEITLEMHPSHVTAIRLAEFRAAGVTRVSTGIQAITDDILSAIHATHAADTSHTAMEALSNWEGQAAIDLLYRCPGQSLQKWCSDIQIILKKYHIPHFSCYTLFLPNESNQPSRENDLGMAAATLLTFQNEGLCHYASCATGGFDFAIPGHECRYERLHWGAAQSSYLGLGPGALGFASNTVTANVNEFNSYAKLLSSNRLPLCSSTEVTTVELMHRYMSLGIKTVNLTLSPFISRFGESPLVIFHDEIEHLSRMGMITYNSTEVSLTSLGRLYVDQISEVFWSDSQKKFGHPDTNVLRDFERKHSLANV